MPGARRALSIPAMGFLRDRGDHGRRFVMREKMFAIGDDFWIEDEDGDKVYKANGKALRVRKTFILEDRDGNERAHVQDRIAHVRGTMAIEREGRPLATVHKRIVGIRDRFTIELEEGGELSAKGNVLEHNFEIKRDDDVIANVSKKWVRVRETYGVEIAPGEDETFLLACVVAIDALVD
jgi:uncharacterized protein YxjI